MAPAEIPDSDDEDELGLAPSPRSVGGEVDEEVANMPDQRPDATRSGSTDPAFFQSVYDEHNDAARRKSRAKHARRLEKDVADPYDIPSSPVEARGSLPEVGGSRGLRDGGKKRKLTVAGSALLDTQESVLRDGEDGGLPLKRRKKRGRDVVESEHDEDEVNLVTIPTPSDDEQVEKAYPLSSMLPPPTLPSIEYPSTLDPLQAPDMTPHLAASESHSYLPSQDQGPSVPAQVGLLVRSSGSATIVNTPRSQQQPMSMGNNDKSPVAGRVAEPVWIGSSPDMLAASETPRRSGRARNRPSRVNEMSPLAEDEQHNELNAGLDPVEYTEPAGYTSNEEPAVEEEPAVVEEPTKGKKKQRGRPKKNATPVRESAPPASPKTAKKAAKAPAKGKKGKKRGRPKKSEQEAPDLEVPPPEEVPETLDEDDTTGMEQKDVVEQAEDVQRADTEISEEHGLEGDEPKQKGPRTTKSVKGQDTPAQSTPKNPTKAATEPVEVKKATPAAASAGLSSTKPLYRVGLSKRSRIAPLLKIVRKD